MISSPGHPDCWLVGVRKGAHGAGKYALPGGHLELGESWADCLVREVAEETALTVENLKLVSVTNDAQLDGRKELHYVTIVMTATIAPGSRALQNLEPHKCAGWRWMPWTELAARVREDPDSLFEPLLHFIEQSVTILQRSGVGA